MKLTSYRFCSRHRASSRDAHVSSLERRGAEEKRRSPHSAHFTTTSLLQRRGVIALITVGGGALGVVYFVHRLQTRERQTMRQAVYRDIEKLEKLKKAQNGATDK